MTMSTVLVETLLSDSLYVMHQPRETVRLTDQNAPFADPFPPTSVLRLDRWMQFSR